MGVLGFDTHKIIQSTKGGNAPFFISAYFARTFPGQQCFNIFGRLPSFQNFECVIYELVGDFITPVLFVFDSTGKTISSLELVQGCFPDSGQYGSGFGMIDEKFQIMVEDSVVQVEYGIDMDLRIISARQTRRYYYIGSDGVIRRDIEKGDSTHSKNSEWKNKED